MHFRETTMRRLRGKTWLNFVATLLLAAVISPMADATQPVAAPNGFDGTVASAHVRLDKVATLDAGAKASRKSTDLTQTAATDALTDTAGRNGPVLALAQIPAGLSGAVYYDSRLARADLAQAEPAQTTATPFSGFAVPGKWTSVLATALLFGFLFWRRAS